jgi:hypothetical protein
MRTVDLFAQPVDVPNCDLVGGLAPAQKIITQNLRNQFSGKPVLPQNWNQNSKIF